MTDTLRSICEQSTYLNNPRLDFIPDSLPRHKEIILRDLRELVSVASGEHEKAVVVLAGSILETVLCSFLKVREAQITALRGEEFTFPPKPGLQDYLNIFNKWFRNEFPSLQLRDDIVDYRHLVHFNRELESPPGECGRAARMLLRTVDALLGELAQFGRAGA